MSDTPVTALREALDAVIQEAEVVEGGTGRISIPGHLYSALVGSVRDLLASSDDVAGSGERLREAGLAVLRATDAYTDAVNGQGHVGTEHDRAIHMDPCTSDPETHVYSPSTDCAACGGAEYGTEDALQEAIVGLRLALGEPLKPYEEHRLAATQAPREETPEA